ncbi:hypothetical protein DMUE_3701 [Dictyocoela muelleri]|nr:hypothetical protein DMUE_3701 [Dictyocoela muelleri]
MNYTRMKLTLIPVNRNSNGNKTTRAQYGTSLLNINDNQMIFLDETGFNLHSHQRFGYSLKNSKCFINVPNSKGTNISFLYAITNEDILAFKARVGSFKSTDLKDFIETQLLILDQNDMKYIIMDNASIHRTAEVRVSLARRNYILKFIPSYSPQLNPIVDFFSTFKSRVKQLNNSSNSNELIDVINSVLLSGAFRLEGHFDHMRV